MTNTKQMCYNCGCSPESTVLVRTRFTTVQVCEQCDFVLQLAGVLEPPQVANIRMKATTGPLEEAVNFSVAMEHHNAVFQS